MPETSAVQNADRALLAICIPTYNRGLFLSELLESIVREIAALPSEFSDYKIEVVVSDNASSDDTAERIAAFDDRLSITYVRQPENIGPDRNYLAVVAAAQATFCWLMGSDDIVEAGGLTQVVRAASEWDVAGFSVNYHRRSFDLEQTSSVRPPVSHRCDIIVEGRDRIYKDFAGHFGFISGHIFRRELWQEVVETGEANAFLNGYVHVLILGRILDRLPRWGYLHDICVGWRGRNDSFAAGDHVHRLMVDVVGYRSITEHLFGRQSATTSAVMDSIVGTHILVHYRVAKVFYHSGASLRQAARTLMREYWRYPSFWKKIVPWMIIPAPILHGTWVGYQRARHRLDPTFKIHPQARARS